MLVPVLSVENLKVLTNSIGHPWVALSSAPPPRKGSLSAQLHRR